MPGIFRPGIRMTVGRSREMDVGEEDEIGRRISLSGIAPSEFRTVVLTPIDAEFRKRVSAVQSPAENVVVRPAKDPTSADCRAMIRALFLSKDRSGSPFPPISPIFH